MPFKSKSQQRFMFAAEDRGEVPEGTAERWAHHTKNIKKLPEKVKGHSGRRKQAEDDPVAVIAQLAVERPLVEKLAADTQLSHPEIYQLAGMVDLPIVDFVKHAYANTQDFVDFLRVVGGHKPEKQAREGGLLSKVLGALRTGGEYALSGARRAGEYGQQASKAIDERLGLESRLGNAEKGLFNKGRLGGLVSTPGRRVGTAAAGATAGAGAVGTGLYGASKGILGLMNRGQGQGQPNMQAGAGPGGAPGPNETALNQQVPQAAAMQGNLGNAAAPAGPGQPAGGGMSPIMKALLLGGGAVGAGGLGYMMGRRRNQVKESVDEMAKSAMRRAIVKKAAQRYREKVAQLLCSHLDKVAQLLPLEKSAAVRAMQKEVSAGKPLALAIKVAYPHLAGEKRGILAAQLVRSALASQKRANLMAGPASVMSPSGAQMGQHTQPQQGLTASPGTSTGVPQVQTRTFQGTPAEGLAFMNQGG